MTAASPSPGPTVRMRGIGKSFDGVRVLDDVDFEVLRGEIHALVGGNGAGKSTLMKILEGVYPLEEGSIEVEGQPVSFRSSQDARRAGIAMIFQEFSLVSTLSVAQNVFLTREPGDQLGLIDDREMERRTRALFEGMEVDIDPRRSVDELPTAERQLTEIAKALSQDARVLIMDEPTSSLGRSETVLLFGLMERLKAQGISMVYISHRMEEIFEVADRITVLRDGRNVWTEAAAQVTPREVINAIVGRQDERGFEWRPREVIDGDDVLLEVRGLHSGSRVHGVDLVLHRGEIRGPRRTDGQRPQRAGARHLRHRPHRRRRDLLLAGTPVSLRDPQAAIDSHIALIPEDRHDQGLVIDHSVRDNAPAPTALPAHALGPRWMTAPETAWSSCTSTAGHQDAGAEPAGAAPVRRQPAEGRHRQVAGHRARRPHPRRADGGVDIGTKNEIVEMIRESSPTRATPSSSSPPSCPELLAVSDRVLVMRDGRVERAIPRATSPTRSDLHLPYRGFSDGPGHGSSGQTGGSSLVDEQPGSAWRIDWRSTSSTSASSSSSSSSPSRSPTRFPERPPTCSTSSARRPSSRSSPSA